MHVSTAPGVSENEPGIQLWHLPYRRYLPAGHGRHWVFSDIAPMTPSVDVPVGHSLQLDWKTPPVVFANVFSSHCTHLLFIPFSKLPSGHGVQYESLYGCCPRGHVWHSVIPCLKATRPVVSVSHGTQAICPYRAWAYPGVQAVHLHGILSISKCVPGTHGTQDVLLVAFPFVHILQCIWP